MNNDEAQHHESTLLGAMILDSSQIQAAKHAQKLKDATITGAQPQEKE